MLPLAPRPEIFDRATEKLRNKPILLYEGAWSRLFDQAIEKAVPK